MSGEKLSIRDIVLFADKVQELGSPETLEQCDEVKRACLNLIGRLVAREYRSAGRWSPVKPVPPDATCLDAKGRRCRPAREDGER